MCGVVCKISTNVMWKYLLECLQLSSKLTLRSTGRLQISYCISHLSSWSAPCVVHVHVITLAVCMV